ncbi:MAG: class I SAM-dependent methyltransferase [Gemmatimonadota bacterium]
MPSTEDVKSWYNQHYAAKGLESMRPAAAYPVFLDLLGATHGTRLLDVSCGTGSLLAAAQQRGVAPVGIDLSDEAVRLAKRMAPGAEVTVGAGETLPFRDASFDFVSCLGSLEHFLDMGQGLEEMKRVAKPSGRFCIMVPNQDFIGWKVIGRQGTAQQDINEHLLPLSDWRRLFAGHGLAVRKVVPDRWHAVRWRAPGARGLKRLVTGPALEAAWRLIPLHWQYQFVFVLERDTRRPTSP